MEKKPANNIRHSKLKINSTNIDKIIAKKNKEKLLNLGKGVNMVAVEDLEVALTKNGWFNTRFWSK